MTNVIYLVPSERTFLSVSTFKFIFAAYTGFYACASKRSPERSKVKVFRYKPEVVLGVPEG